MADAQRSRHFLLFFSFTFLCSFFSSVAVASAAAARTAARTHALVLPVTKDPATLQYVTRIRQGTPPANLNLVVDLGGRFVWVDCDRRRASSTYRPVLCRTALCILAKPIGCGDCFTPPRPWCNASNSCTLGAESPSAMTNGALAQDVLSLASTDGSAPGPLVADPGFLFSCAPSFLLRGLARGAKGMAGLGRNRVGMPSQLAAAFGLRWKFAVCLSGSCSDRGSVFFGDGPYHVLMGVDASKSLTYTPLLLNPVSTAGASIEGEPSAEYFVGVTAITINGKAVTIDKTLLSINKLGIGGTKISTVEPYTTLQSSIYRAVAAAFAAALPNVPRVAPVAPFGLCFDATRVGRTRTGPAVPTIDLMLQGVGTYWRIYGSNSMVPAGEKAMCLAMVEGLVNPTTSIVIGAYQLEDNLLQFDLAASKLGFSSSLLTRQMTCSGFNFSTAPSAR